VLNQTYDKEDLVKIKKKLKVMTIRKLLWPNL